MRNGQRSGQLSGMPCQRSMIRVPNETLQASLKQILLYKTGLKYVLSPSRRRPMSCAGHSNWMMTRRTLPHPKPVPNTRMPKNGESFGRCNRTNMTCKGRLCSGVCYLGCYLNLTLLHFGYKRGKNFICISSKITGIFFKM